ncbi:unnamed protein product, partial [Pneumocystis jirovecii]
MERLEQFSGKPGVQDAVLCGKGVQSLNTISVNGCERISEPMIAKEACETGLGASQNMSLVEGVGSRTKKKKKKRTKHKLPENSGSGVVHLETCYGRSDFSLSECKQACENRFLNEPEYDPASPNLSFPIHRELPLTASFSSSNNILGPMEKKASSRKKKKKKKAVIGDSYHSSVASDGIVQPPPQYRVTSRKQKDQIWNISTHEERERIKEFWLQLGEEERRGLVKIEKEAVLKKMKEQQKHSCSCSVCDRKRIAIEEELEVLYDAYYEELEQYANQQQRFSSLSLLRKNSLAGRPEDLEDSEGMLDSDGEYDESILSESVDPRFDFFNFGNNLTVKEQGGILTVADDLLKNDGKKFIEMMEQLAERRIQKEEGTVMEIETTEFDSDDEDYDEESEDDEMNTLDEEQRIEEGRRMFQIFAARMFEQRVLIAYREKVAEERQQRLLEELEEESRLKEERELKKAKEKERKKDKKKLQKQLKDQEKARKEAERLAEKNALRIEEEKRLEEAKKKKEELRLKREAEKKALEEEKRRQLQDKEKEHEREKKRKEIDKERQKKESNIKKEKEVKENENKTQNPKEKNEHEQITLENISNNAISPIKETRSPVSSSLNSSSILSLKTEHESDNSLSSSSVIFSQSQSSLGLQNTSQKSPHMSSNSSSTLQHPPGFDITLGQNLSSTHSTYQSLTSHPIINNVPGGIFASASVSPNQQYDYSLSPLKLFKATSNNYKNETSSLSASLNNYHSLPITSTTTFPRPFHHIEDKDHNSITGVLETRNKVLDDNTTRVVSNTTAKPIKRPSPIQRPSGTVSCKDESRKTPTISELSEVMGSKALLDDNDNDSIISNHINDVSDWNNKYYINQNLLRQRCKLICLRLDEQYGPKTRLFLVDQVLNLYNDLFSDTPVQTKQILDACAISGNSQNGGGFFTCKIEGQHVMIRYDDILDQTPCKSGFSSFSTM